MIWGRRSGRSCSSSITVWLEHREGIALTAIRPYKQKLTGRIEFFDLLSESGQQRIWG